VAAPDASDGPGSGGAGSGGARRTGGDFTVTEKRISLGTPAEAIESPSLRAAIEISSVSKSFLGGRRRMRAGSRPALVDVNLKVNPGEFLCLLGPSGCGKSTLLNIIAGFLPSDTGEVLVDGEPVKGPGHNRGVLFQSPQLFPWLTTLENVLYGPRARRVLTPEVREQADALLETVGLADFRDVYPHELSGGMRHRAAFARVLINRPSVLLMDEPFGALDAITRANMQRFLLDLWQRDSPTIVFVTHDVEEATLLSDRVCIMSGRPGRIKALFDVGLPRPRTYEETETLDFVTIKRRIRSALESSDGTTAEGRSTS
jgi:NitT/TauT family transport system ATP-binding protein